MSREKLAYEAPEDRGYVARAYYLNPPLQSDAEIEIVKAGEVVRTFTYPAYRIWNIAAHFSEVVDDLIAKVPR